FLAAGLALVICALKSTANYIQPYAYAALYGLVFALGSLIATVSYIRLRSERLRLEYRLQAESLGDLPPEGGTPNAGAPNEGATTNAVLAGLLAGLSLISKPELALAALAAGFTALTVESFAERRPLWRDAAAFAAPVVIITAATYAIILSHTPLRVLLEDNHVLFTAMPPQLVYFNRHVSGLAQWPTSLWFSLAGIGGFALWAGFCGVIGAFASRKQAEWRGVFKAGLIVAGAGVLWRESAIELLNVPSAVTPFASAGFVLPAVIGLIVWTLSGNSPRISALSLGLCAEESSRRPQLRVLLVIAVFSFVSILRAILNITTSGAYTPFLLPALVIVYLYLLFRVAPDLLAKTDSIRLNIRRAAMMMIALMIVGMGVNSTILLRRRNTFTVSSSRGSFVTVPEIGEPLQAAIRYVEQRTGPDDYVLSAPQGTTINFLAARRYPLREEIIHPGFLAGEKELDAIERIETRETPLILIANIDTSEFSDRAFGVDYNQGLMRWVNEKYHLAARFDSAHSHNATLGDPPFFILVYERNP
ncbi:MAG TPA: hypothetical protein VKE91_00930, partial [Blastocatellia bacterium]|nr:hypothetical protein [Blastocatellia bacterium]